MSYDELTPEFLEYVKKILEYPNKHKTVVEIIGKYIVELEYSGSPDNCKKILKKIYKDPVCSPILVKYGDVILSKLFIVGWVNTNKYAKILEYYNIDDNESFHTYLVKIADNKQLDMPEMKKSPYYHKYPILINGLLKSRRV